MATDKSLTNKDTAETRLRGAVATSPRANEGILTLHRGSLLDQCKVTGDCVTAFGKSRTVLLSLLLVCKRGM